MSTYYYPFAPPVSSVRIESIGATHAHVTVFVRGANTGRLTLRAEEVSGFTRLLVSGCAAAQIVATRDGPRLKTFMRGSLYLLQEDGREVTSLAELQLNYLPFEDRHATPA